MGEQTSLLSVLDEHIRQIVREEIERFAAAINPVEDRLLRAKEVATMIGVSTWSVYQLHKGGELPALVRGRSKRWRESTVKAYIEQAPKLPKEKK